MILVLLSFRAFYLDLESLRAPLRNMPVAAEDAPKSPDRRGRWNKRYESVTNASGHAGVRGGRWMHSAKE
jgi:hypothetical protein